MSMFGKNRTVCPPCVRYYETLIDERAVAVDEFFGGKEAE
jgi:hypothetical protein